MLDCKTWDVRGPEHVPSQVMENVFAGPRTLIE